MFRRLPDTGKDKVILTIEGRKLQVPASDSVAAAMLSAGVGYSRTTVSGGSRRAPFCMMGACFECLVEIDGIPNQQSCQVQVREGMNVKLQRGARVVDPE
jgi:predicted molibdopterin-dependent oxidoreductase YjgC